MIFYFSFYSFRIKPNYSAWLKLPNVRVILGFPFKLFCYFILFIFLFWSCIDFWFTGSITFVSFFRSSSWLYFRLRILSNHLFYKFISFTLPLLSDLNQPSSGSYKRDEWKLWRKGSTGGNNPGRAQWTSWRWSWNGFLVVVVVVVWGLSWGRHTEG